MNPGQFVRLIRVPTLAATVVPLIVGGAVAYSQGEFSPFLWLIIFGVALLMQIATNILNEYGDFRRKIDLVPSAGFAGLILSGEATAREVLLAAISCYVAAAALGLVLVFFRGVLILLLLGMVAILGGIFYSEGPLPVSSTPFGEVLVALLMGPIEILSADLAASGTVSSLAFVVSIPVGLMVAAILLTNNLRDIDKDRSRGRRTLAVLIGRRSGSNLLFILILLTFLWTIPAFALFETSASVFLTWFAFPIALPSYYRIINGGWSRSVVLISRVHVLVGTLLTISILVHF